jgi:glycine/D-amino acid oxidase-like deaminating enzyme/nitrite reductase/ring-hydroxylating ferredoxin subunit
MTTQSYWMESARLPRFPGLKKDVKVDVAVVGGGITGVTAACLFKKAGRTVALLERDRCARVDTGHTTAHLTYVTDERLHQLVKHFGHDHAQAVWDAGRAAIDQIRGLVEEHGLDCGFAWVPGYLHARLDRQGRGENDSLQQDAQLAAAMGFDAAFQEAVPLVDRPGVRFANQARFHPLRYLAGLLPLIPGDGSHVFEGTDVTQVRDDPLAVEANGHTVGCDYLVIATHVPLMGKAGLVGAALFQSKLAPYTSYAVGARLPKGAVPDALFWDTADPYRYLRIDAHRGYDYAIFGGEDHKTGQHTDPELCFNRLEETLASLLPEAKVDCRWSGQVIETNDGLPFIGETADKQFAATGFAGNGMTFGTLAAMMAVDAVLGRNNPWRELFDVGRKKLRGGTWDYLKENIDYPYYYLKDRLAAAEGKTFRSVKRGEGKILKIDKRRVAAYRSPEGKLTVLSPVCTHMGCIVHWNSAESTWDCPCHGSRFRATGEVLAGPAETPLEAAELEKPARV